MKKCLIILVALIGFGISANAQRNMYKVTVSIQKTYHYYDENAREVGTSTELIQPYVDNYCAETPEAAKDKAKSDCYTVCSRSGHNSEGNKTYKGKSYKTTSTRANPII
jgi:hypothetical protein